MRIKLSPSVCDPEGVIQGIEINEIRDMSDFNIMIGAEDSAKLIRAIAPFVVMENSNETD